MGTVCARLLNARVTRCWRNILTDSLDEVGKQHAVRHVSLEISDPPLATATLQIVVRPVRVDLRKNKDDIRNNNFDAI